MYLFSFKLSASLYKSQDHSIDTKAKFIYRKSRRVHSARSDNLETKLRLIQGLKGSTTEETDTDHSGRKIVVVVRNSEGEVLLCPKSIGDVNMPEVRRLTLPGTFAPKDIKKSAARLKRWVASNHGLELENIRPVSHHTFSSLPDFSVYEASIAGQTLQFKLFKNFVFIRPELIEGMDFKREVLTNLGNRYMISPAAGKIILATCRATPSQTLVRKIVHNS
jgi:hypothetical protein